MHRRRNTNRNYLSDGIGKIETETSKFVVQKHSQGSKVHWDLMLKVGDVLKTFRLESPPDELLQRKTSAEKIFDHPLKFLTYEGDVNDGRGNVKIADAGAYRTLSENENCWKLQLDGSILKGKSILSHLEGDKWEFSFSQAR
jgi:bifunctional non-homologous end joining protein LigD